MQLSFDTHAAVRQPLSGMFSLPNDGASPVLPVPKLPISMRRGETLALGRPQVVICAEGTLWIVHDDEPGDHVLETGGRRTAGRARLHVHAMTDARVEFVAL